MKRKDKNLEKNISRLVKLTGDKDRPSEKFTESLIDKALSELKQQPDRKREGRTIEMKVTLKTLGWAAMFVVVAGAGYMLFTHSGTTTPIGSQFAKVTEKVKPEESIVKEYRPSKPAPAKTSKPAKIEYTESKKLPQAVISDLKLPKEMSLKTDMELGEITNIKNAGVARVKVTDAGSAKGRLMLESLGYIKQGTSHALMERPASACKWMENLQRASGFPMAHGGTTPPNGEDVDAMFFKNYGVNPFVDTEDDHLSTFATDVDTGSYTVVRRFLHDGHLPPNDAVRVEEFINYFDYGYKAPQEDDFAIYTEAAPWKFGRGRKNSYLMRIGLKVKQISDENRKPAILTFVIDVSGSMRRENRLGLVKKSLRLLIDNLKTEDMIGIAVYGSRGRIVMPHKGLHEKSAIISAIEALHTEGATNAEEGIRIGYEMAEQAFRAGWINRVILCSDGVANIGRTGADDIFEIIKSKADKGVTLSAIGFGMGNYNDVMMEQLGDKGNGYYTYIDTITEAKRLFGENLTGALQVVARDVKIQVDFNPDVVRSYRLIGYENRDVADNKFRDDKQDGGEIGAGHSVTALYELKLWEGKQGTAATTYVRYKDAEGKSVTEFKSSIDTKDFRKSFDGVSNDFALAATVTEFAEILRKSYWAKGAKLDDVLKKAQKLNEKFKDNKDVIELVDLIAKSKELTKDEPKESAEDKEQD